MVTRVVAFLKLRSGMSQDKAVVAPSSKDTATAAGGKGRDDPQLTSEDHDDRFMASLPSTTEVTREASSPTPSPPLVSLPNLPNFHPGPTHTCSRPLQTQQKLSCTESHGPTHKLLTLLLHPFTPLPHRPHHSQHIAPLHRGNRQP